MPDITGRALDAAVAERVLRWERLPDYDELGGAWRTPDGSMRTASDLEYDPSYGFSWSHHAVATVRAEIERRGLIPEFMDELIDTVGPERWRILTATPEQQCRAALAAVEAQR